MSPEDVEKCTERFSKAKAVSSILRHVAELLKYETDEQLEELYEKTAWYFEEKHKNKTASYDIFKQAVLEPALLDECKLDENTKSVLLNNIKRKLTSQAMKIRADIECACYGYEGIDAVKQALLAGLKASTEEIPIKINLIAPPLYVITTSTPEKADGLKALENAIELIETTIKKLDGHFAIQMAVSSTGRMLVDDPNLFHFSRKSSQPLTKQTWPEESNALNWRTLKFLATRTLMTTRKVA